MNAWRVNIMLAATLLLAACGGTYGNNPFQPRPNGTINVLLQGGSATPISTSLSSPLHVTGAFAFSVNEPGYSGGFTASVISWTVATTAPCLAAPLGVQKTLLAFGLQASPPISGSGSSPCGTVSDTEGIAISDTIGHTVTQYVTFP